MGFREEGISVIICCYNSADRIRQTMSHIFRQSTMGMFNYEVIIIDNNSSDNTVKVVENLRTDTTCPIHIISELRAGLIFARETGIRSAKYNYVVFCDDDNWLCENYLFTIFNHLNNNPNTGAIGGRGIARFEKDFPVPAWFTENENSYAVGVQATESGIVTSRGFLWGAGMGVRKELMLKCFDPDFPFLLGGRKGLVLNSGDDSEICCRIIICGYDLYYEKEISFMHFLPSMRVTPAYLSGLLESFERSYRVLSLYSIFISRLKSNGKKNREMKLNFNIRKSLRHIINLCNHDRRIISRFYRKHRRKSK